MIAEIVRATAWTVKGYWLSCGHYVYARHAIDRIANHLFCIHCDGRFFIIETEYLRND